MPKQTSYARVLSGEIPILLDYDFNAYRAKYKDKANVEFVIPTEGTVVVPYVMSLVKNVPAPGQRQEGARLRAVRQGAGDLGQRVPAAGARRRHVSRGRGQVPARGRIRASQAGRLTPRWRRSQNAFRDRYLQRCAENRPIGAYRRAVEHAQARRTPAAEPAVLPSAPGLSSFFAAFFLLPMCASGPARRPERPRRRWARIPGDSHHPRYLQSLLATVLLSLG